MTPSIWATMHYVWSKEAHLTSPRNSKLRTQNSEIVYLTINLQIHATHKLNNYIIPIGAWETSFKTKRIVASTDATQWYCIDHPICENYIIIKFKL